MHNASPVNIQKDAQKIIVCGVPFGSNHFDVIL